MANRILMVEDEQSILLAVTDYMDQLGYQVDTATTLEQAEALLAAHPYVAVITDLRLTGTDANEGLRLAGTVKAHHPNTEVILLSAYGSPEVERQARASGVSAFLHKPKPLAELAQIVYSVLSERETKSAPLAPERSSRAVPVEAIDQRVARFSLTSEELEVARLVGEGRTNDQIADALGIQEQRVRAHRDTIARRLDPRSRFELALYLVRQGSHS